MLEAVQSFNKMTQLEHVITAVFPHSLASCVVYWSLENCTVIPGNFYESS